MKKGCLLIAVSLLICMFSGVAAAAAKPLACVSVVGTEHNWDINAYNGVLDTLRAAGIEVRAFDGERKNQKQANDLETIAQLKPDVAVVILGTTNVLLPGLKKIDAAGIPIVTVDLQNPYSTCNVSSDNYSMGIDIALQIVNDLHGQGELAVFFKPGAWVADVRRQSLDIVLKDFPGIKIVAEQPYISPGTVPDAMNKMENILKAHPEVDAVWSLFDMPVIGAAMAIQAAGKQDQVKCYGIDGDPQAMSMLRSGKSAYAATVVQQPYLIGKTAGKIALDIIKGKEVPYAVWVDHLVATEENVEEIIQTVDTYKDIR